MVRQLSLFLVHYWELFRHCIVKTHQLVKQVAACWEEICNVSFHYLLSSTILITAYKVCLLHLSRAQVLGGFLKLFTRRSNQLH